MESISLHRLSLHGKPVKALADVETWLDLNATSNRMGYIQPCSAIPGYSSGLRCVSEVQEFDYRKTINNLNWNLNRDGREGLGFVFGEGGQVEEGCFRSPRTYVSLCGGNHVRIYMTGGATNYHSTLSARPNDNDHVAPMEQSRNSML